MLGNKVSVFGATGFIGREVVNELSKAGFEITVLVRRPERYREFALYPNTKIQALTSYDNVDELNAALKGRDMLVNLTADRSTGTEMIEQHDLFHINQKLKSAAESAGVKRVLSLSQIGASATKDDNDWLRLLGEVDGQMLGTASADVTVFRASLIIGANDDTTSRFIKQLDRIALLMVAKSDCVVQPVWVKDFAKAMVGAARNRDTFGQKMDVAGEERLTFKELAELVAELKEKDAIVFPMCTLNAKIMAKLGAFAPIASVSASQLLMLNEDLVTDEDFSTRFGFVPSSLEWLIATYAAPHHIRERYNYYRKEAGRNARELI